MQTSSNANYWKPFSTEVKGEWNGNQLDGVVEVDWADVAVTLNTSGLYEVVGDEHQLEVSAELKMPSLASWHQLKSFIKGTMSIGRNPSKLKVNVAKYKPY